MAKILVVEDQPNMLQVVSTWLQAEKHVVDCAETGQDALLLLKSEKYDLIVLDWELPDISGTEVLSQYRARRGISPVLMLTGRNTIQDKITGFNEGADDYLTKPYELLELSARIHALLRRPATLQNTKIELVGIVVDLSKRQAFRGDEEIKLQPMEFALLEFLMRHPGEVFSPEALLERVWSSEAEATADIIRKYISRLREKIDTQPGESLIRTVHGVGYSFAAGKQDK